ncbi:MAG: PrsW family glutamic-type intramembrane protease [Bacteroidota bacterium]
MDILIISLAPVAVIAFYVWFRDKYEREPLRMVLLAMLSGALTVIPVIPVEGLIASAGKSFEGIAGAAWHAFAVAGFTEELFKFLVLFLLIWRSAEFNDKYDGIVYATFISLGFAGVENVLYVTESGYTTGIMRAVTAVPAHAIFGITMGFYLGMARFYPQKRSTFLFRAFWFPFLLHGIYDFILMTGIEWLWIVFVGFVIYLYVLGHRKMKVLSVQSYYRTDYELLNRKFGSGD